jgi:hypothetical protein
MNWTNRPLWHYVVAAAILGALTVGAAAAHVAAAGPVFEILAVGVAALTGVAAHHTKTRPGPAGIAVGAVFGFVAGFAGFVTKVTAALIRSEIAARKLTLKGSISGVVRFDNSTAAHLIDLVGAVILFAIVGLIVAAIAGAIANRRSQQHSGV